LQLDPLLLHHSPQLILLSRIDGDAPHAKKLALAFG
jgi:hypothetical protein